MIDRDLLIWCEKNGVDPPHELDRIADKMLPLLVEAVYQEFDGRAAPSAQEVQAVSEETFRQAVPAVSQELWGTHIAEYVCREMNIMPLKAQ